MVLNFLRVLIQRLTAEVSREHNIKHSDFTCQLVPFGSWGLRAHLAQDDMDLAFLGAKHVRRRDFFHFFPKLLKEQATVMNVEVIDSARVPIIRCTVDSIPVDISFVRLRIQSIPQDIDLSNNGLLTGLDDACMASLDGKSFLFFLLLLLVRPRVHQFILQHISESDLPTFRIALQSIKYWAQQRAIYDKQMGYLGGHAWALLLLKTYMANTKSASTTQLSANSNPISLLRTFFQMWSAWPWPTPVILTDFIPNHDGTPLEYRSLALFEGTIMPIVSPCYPVSNVANTVTKSTLKVLMHEFSRAHQILSLLTQPDDTVFNKLFKPLNMIIKYKHFLKIIVSTDTYNTHEAWLGKMPSAIPRFVEFLETVPEIREIRPYIDPFIRISINFRTKYEKTALQNGDNVNGLDYKMLDLDPGTINRTCYLIGLEVISPSPGCKPSFGQTFSKKK
ncbi:Poly(A) polymerase central domain-containing protein [Dichotomocladium elegans]|nr:Poly(A) polymerase central domain-containing protein [Dichotomocladium elegans]